MSGFSMRYLGKTDLLVSPLGIGCGSGIASQDLLYAFDRGVNYFFFSSDLHHFLYRRSAEALHTLCKQGSAVREKVILATVTYVRHPDQILGVLFDQFAELGVDYIDVFHWGWITDADDLLPFLKLGRQLKQATFAQVIQPMMQMLVAKSQIWEKQAQVINEELLKRGLVRYIGASFHSRTLARRWMNDLDILMLRYNMAHLGVEQEIVPFLSEEKKRNPGIVVFNVAHPTLNLLYGSSANSSPDHPIPSVPTCYRFALSQPWVDVVLAGPSNREEIDSALAALEQGPLSVQECEAIRGYGKHFQTHTQTGV